MQAVEEWMQSIALMLPVMIAYFSMTTAMLNHWFARRILSRIGTEVSAFPPLQEWKLPRSIVYYYVLAVVLLIFTGGREGNFGMVLENIRMLLGFMLMIQGLSFVVFFLHHRKWWKGLAVIFLFPPLSFILSILGIIDLGFPMREKITHRS